MRGRSSGTGSGQRKISNEDRSGSTSKDNFRSQRPLRWPEPVPELRPRIPRFPYRAESGRPKGRCTVEAGAGKEAHEAERSVAKRGLCREEPPKKGIFCHG